MENNDKCVILSKKEYEELITRNTIRIDDFIQFEGTQRVFIYFNITNFELIGNLYKQLKRIEKLLSDKLNVILSEINVEKEILKLDRNEFLYEKTNLKQEVYKEIANMSYFERRKFLKQWKDK